jgi:hypothetical protein
MLQLAPIVAPVLRFVERARQIRLECPECHNRFLARSLSEFGEDGLPCTRCGRRLNLTAGYVRTLWLASGAVAGFWLWRSGVHIVGFIFSFIPTTLGLFVFLVQFLARVIPPPLTTHEPPSFFTRLDLGSPPAATREHSDKE